MSIPTIRAALDWLLAVCDTDESNVLDIDPDRLVDAIAFARAALAAEPVGEGPSEEAIAEMAEELEWRRLPLAEGTGNSFFLDLALAILDRWGHPAAPPAPETPAEALAARPVAAMEICHGHQDGECHWEQCPQLRDSEPAATGRSCPLPLDPVDIERAALARWGHPAAPPVPDAGDVGERPTWEIVLQEDDCAPDARASFEHDFCRLSGGLDVGSFKSLAQYEERDCGMTQSWLLGDLVLSISADDPFYDVKKRKRPAAPPVPDAGEVREALADLENLELAFKQSFNCNVRTSRIRPVLLHYATLLQQRAAPAPPAPEVGKAVGSLIQPNCTDSFLIQRQDARITDLRAALRECGQAVGSLIQPNCTDSFLLHVPEEVRLAMAKAAPPAPEVGDVGEVVADLQCAAASYFNRGFSTDARRCRRAAALLQQQQHSLKLALLAQLNLLMEQPPAPAPAVVPVAIPGEQWDEDDGPCLWWRFPIAEPPWAGDPRDHDWRPGYYTHFTRLAIPLPQPNEAKL